MDGFFKKPVQGLAWYRLFGMVIGLNTGVVGRRDRRKAHFLPGMQNGFDPRKILLKHGIHQGRIKQLADIVPINHHCPMDQRHLVIEIDLGGLRNSVGALLSIRGFAMFLRCFPAVFTIVKQSACEHNRHQRLVPQLSPFADFPHHINTVEMTMGQCFHQHLLNAARLLPE
ncbi:hypothetical protein D3C73_738760 [compost metagenome]